MQPAPQLELQSIRFGFEPNAWELRIPELVLGGEGICGVVGPNGAGKSSLLKLGAGLLSPSEGRVRLDGRPVRRLRRRDLARRLGYLPQEVPVLFDYTVAQVAAMGRHAHGGGLGLDAAGDIAAVTRALDAVQMEPFRHRRFSQLSGGERRRAWLAAALAQEPDLLLLDEPTQALDVHHAAAIMDVLARKAAEGLRVVVVMHDLNLAALVCDRLVFLDHGRVAADGAPGNVLTADRIAAAYGGGVEVISHPVTNQPVVLAVK